MRKRRKVAGVLAAAAMAVLAWGTPAQAATPVPTPGALLPNMTSEAMGKLELTEHRVSATTISTLDGHLPNVGVDTVLQSANHPMYNSSSSGCTSTELAARPINPSASSAYCWDTGDALTQQFVPQGLTSSGDADDDGMWGTNKVILSGWTNNNDLASSTADDDGLARVAFIDANTPGAFKYRWVLLVVPTKGGDDFDKLGSHLGGMVWYGNKLLVTASRGDDSDNALFVFDFTHILQATVNSHEIGQVSGGYSARGYQYIMPAIGSYSLGGGCSGTSITGYPCFDGLTMDRSTSPYSIVANEWRTTGGDAQPARIFRYALAAPGSAMPLVTSGGKAYADPTKSYVTNNAAGLQAVLANNDKYYAADALWGPGVHGIMWKMSNTGVATSHTCSGQVQANACWAQHSEGMSLWWSTQQLWSQTEWAANSAGGWSQPAVPERVLFSVPFSNM
ncbi:hypothetical protein [Streptomyces sp. NBC_01615]|uniref:hypothetical protein n=1 Tax=Streptomyces sp. NBC_01615 TaxID=2975898 RepID=UPI0038673446